MGAETRARLGLAGLLAAALFSFELVFDGDAHVGPALLGSLLALVISALARRWGAGSIITLGVSLVGLFWYVSVVFQGHNTFWGLPTAEAVSELSRLLSVAYEASLVDSAPVPIRAGYAIMIVAAFWLATTIGELGTFRWRRPTVAALPCLTLTAVSLVVGTGKGAAFFVVVFLAALLTYWGLEASYRLRSWGRWVATWAHRPEKEPERITASVARRMGLSCVAATVVAPVFLPTLGDGLLPWRNDTGGGSGDGSGEINLLVDIAPRLIEQSDTELFTVLATADSYWRLASLAGFDGKTWHPLDAERTERAGSLFNPTAELGRRVGLVQQIDIEQLEGSYLPAAVEPSYVSGPTVLVDDGSFDLKFEGITESTSYTVTSRVPRFSYAELRLAEAGGLPDPAPYLEIPGGLSPEVRVLRDQWIRGAQTPYEKLVAIQNHLRGPEFEYSTNVESSASTDYLTEFLTETRAGFCQQYATAFAVLARSLGYPSRVSVGFLSGSQTEADEDRYQFVVRGTDAHAWPEVYFAGQGWVAFEPTPRAGQATVPLYTLPPQAATIFRQGETPGTGGGGLGELRIPDPGRGGGQRDEARETAPETAPGLREPPWRAAFARLALWIATILALWLVGVPAAKEWRIRRRYARAVTPAEIAIAAFTHFQIEAAEVQLAAGPAESAPAFARRIGGLHRAPLRPVLRLAELYEAAVYSPEGVNPAQAGEAKRVARSLRAELWSRSSLVQKAMRLFSVRSLLPELRAVLATPRRRLTEPLRAGA